MKSKPESYIIFVGILCVLFAIGLTGYNMFVQIQAKNVSADVLSEVNVLIDSYKSQYVYDDDEKKTYESNPMIEMPVGKVNNSDYIGIITIPKLGMNLPVMAEWTSAASKIAPCRYTGSVYQNDLIIAGHNYSSHFAPISRLVQGDEVMFTDMEGNEFKYTVIDMETVNGRDIDSMLEGDWDLTLFTCNFSGNSRITVRCIRQDRDEIAK